MYLLPEFQAYLKAPRPSIYNDNFFFGGHPPPLPTSLKTVVTTKI